MGVVTGFVIVSCGGQPQDEHAHEHKDDVFVAKMAHTHEKAGDTCFICDASKRDKGRLWCNEHGRYEDRCWLCHPELEDKARLYCKEHHLYEDECHLCHPELEKKTPAPKTSEHIKNEADVFTASVSSEPELFCNEHGVPEIECGICQPQLATSLQPGKSLLVRMPSKASADKVGIRSERPLEQASAPSIDVLCEAQYNKNAMTKITPLTAGIVQRVFADVGDQVFAGDVLAELHSAEVATAKSGYLSARVAFDIKAKTKDREKKLLAENISAQKEYIQAEGDFRIARLDVNNARQKLLNLGLNLETIAEIERTEDTSAMLQVRAPFAGTITERTAVPGQSLGFGEALFTLTDLSNRWLILSLPADRLSDVKTGMYVEAQFDELPGQIVKGQIVWIDTAVDTRTRLVQARVLATQGIQQVKSGLFGQAKILTDRSRSNLLVPREALQHHEQRPFVFVKQAADLYALRRVDVGAASAETVEILAGLQPDDAVVTSASFLVMSEFLKSRLGAGCTDH